MKIEERNARDQLTEAVRNYCKVFFDEQDTAYLERFVAGVMAFLHVNYFKETYMPVIGVEEYEQKKKWWEFWK